MGISAEDLRWINSLLTGPIGLPAWGVSLGVGSFVTAEFGAAIPSGSGRTHGEWHLWVRASGWRLQSTDDVLGASEDDRERLRTSLQVLNGKALREFKVARPAGDARLIFDEDLELRLFPITTEDYEHWMEYT